MIEGLGNSVQALIAYAIVVFAGNLDEKVPFSFLFFLSFFFLKIDGARNHIFLSPNVYTVIVEAFSKGSSQTTCA